MKRATVFSGASPRWQKLLGDVRVARRRFIGITIAMSITIVAVAAILTARSILDREMNRNYLDTRPPSAVLSMDAVDEALLQAVRARPGIIAAERDAFISARTKLPSGDSMSLLLRIVPDFSRLQIAKFYPESGAWPPATGDVLIERAVDRMMPINVGAALAVELASGEQRTLRMAGTVHDPGNAPAWQERIVYGYITGDTLKQLDAARSFDLLSVISEAGTTAEIEVAMRDLVLWLREIGHPVHFVRIPPPGQHPHQWQIDSVSLTLLGFSVLAIVLEAALLAIVIGGLLAPQVRQIAVMKAIGARSRQIVGMYSTLVLVLASVALVIGLPIGLLAGHWLASYIADLLNFNIANSSVPGWVYGVCFALGVCVPLCAAAWPIVSASRKSVRESIDYFGVTSNARNSWLQTMTNRLRSGNVSLQLALRNVARRKAQLFMALCLLVLTGVVFMLAGNLLGVWRTITSASIAEQRFDLQVRLRKPQLEAAVVAAIKAVPGVRAVEPVQMRLANADNGDGVPFSTRSVPLRSIPSASELQTLDIAEGRWLEPGDIDAVVLNSAARAGVFSDAQIGTTLSLIVNGKTLRLKVVGVAREMFSPAQAFTTQATFRAAVESDELVRAMLIGVEKGADSEATARSIEAALNKNNFSNRGVDTKADASMGITMHTYIFSALMLLIVISVAKIATAGLASCMSTAVIERTREFGIMRTVGARSHDIQNSVILEALLIGVASWLLAVVLAIPLTIWVAKLLTDIIGRPLPVVFSPTMAFLWLFGVAFVAILASVAPARRAAGLTIQQTLSYT